MDKCFVIQPLDNDKFDKRFHDVFEPAIRKAGFEAYRIDKDLSVRIPINEIENGISESAICFAEITTDNPNVWYELGFASACDKDVIMVCSDERIAGKFPFDIQHKQVIKYKTGSKSDFDILGEDITQKILALQKTPTSVNKFNRIPVPVIETEDLERDEIVFLSLVLKNEDSSKDSVSVSALKIEMSEVGYDGASTSFVIRMLEKKGMIETFKETHPFNNFNEYAVCRLTEKGGNWILSNKNLFPFHKKVVDEEMPF